MSRYTKKKKEHIGLSPYALVFRGQKKTDKSRLQLMSFDLENVTEKEISSREELAALKTSRKENWLNIYGLDNVKMMEDIASVFKLENNVLSDVMNPQTRPKVQELENGIFTSIKILQYNEEQDELNVENLSLIFGKNVLISFQEQSIHAFDAVRDRIRRQNNKIRTAGHDYLAFALLDVVVDNYIYIIGLLGEKIEALEEEMTNDPDKELLDKINIYKRELNFLRKHIKPAREMILSLCKLESDFIHSANHLHFKELQDNINEATELADSYREILYDLLNIYHSTMSTRLNEIMRVLTIISVIFIPITFIAGVYGTNFENIPELHWKYGYYVLWLIMIGTTAGMLWYFRRKKWF